MKKKTNSWKIASLVLIAVIVFQLSLLGFRQINDNKEVNLNGVKISQGQLDKFSSGLDLTKPFGICSLEDNKCALVNGIPKS